MNIVDVGYRQFFKPVQPSICLEKEVSYLELWPDAELASHIYCYWQLKSEHTLLTPFSYRVVPDGCIDVFFDINNLQDSRIMGFSTAHTSFELGTTFHYVGIRFLPGVFPFVFKLDASVLTNREEAFEDVVRGVARQLRSIVEGVSFVHPLKPILDQYFLKKIRDVRHGVDMRIFHAIALILKRHGAVNLQREIDTGISPRQLRRLFDIYVGVSPKTFSKVVRFQYFLQLLSSRKGPSYNKIFLEAGYYDQPHFNRDFKMFFGLTPTDALGL